MPVFAIPAKKPFAIFAGASLLLCAPVFYLSCRGATQVRVEILTDASCEDLAKSPIPVAVVYVGKDGHAVEAIAGRIDPAASSFKCEAVSSQTDGSVLNYLGSLYVTPSGDRDAPFAFSVVAGISGKNTSECGKPADPAQPNDPKRYAQCIVSRRALNFIEHDSLRLPVFLSLDCAGVACGATTTCRKGECVDATIPDLDLCKTELGCGEDTLDAGGGTGGAGGGGSGGASGSGGGGTGGSGTGGAGGAGGGAPVDAPPCGFVAVGSEHSCAAKSDNSVICWGRKISSFGVGNLLGVPGASDPSLAPVALPAASPAIHIDSNYFHNCAVRQDGQVLCWGLNNEKQIGPNPVSNGDEPSPVPLPVKAKRVGAGRTFSCALGEDGSVHCWGSNNSAQLGQPAVAMNFPDPVQVPGLPPVVELESSASQSCAVTSAGALWCWGNNVYNQIGDGLGGPGVSTTPKEIIPGGVRAAALSGYSDYMGAGGSACALFTNGSVKCWGSNNFGQLGAGNGDFGVYTMPSQSNPVGNFNDIKEIAGGRYHVCAVHQTGKVSCWGANNYMQIGNASAQASNPTPLDVDNLNDAEHIFAGGYHSCALRKTKELVCWGSNAYGELGNGAQGGSSAQIVTAPSICTP